MMKRKNIIGLSVVLLATAIFNTACSDQFLEDKKNYDNTNEGAYNYYSGAKGRVDDIYAWSLPDASASVNWKYNSTGLADDHSKSTEEYSGFSAFVNPNAELTYQKDNNTVPDYFHNQASNIQQSVWGRVRNCNDVIRGIQGSTLSPEQKKELLGQVYFFRAWAYYNLVKYYGGVPIISEVQDPIAGADLVIPRSSAKESFDFICNDLYTAAKMLPFKWDGSNYGRVTSGTALALLGRVRLLYASPLFNRTNDKSRWVQAYQDITNSLDTLASGGYGLAYESDPGVNASNWAKMFTEVPSPEAIFVTLYNNLPDGGSTNTYKSNTWENGIRPYNTLGGGGKVPSAMLVDMFPMADGKRPSSTNTYTNLGVSEIAYNPNLPFLNRDPRFYRTFAFPGVRWTFNGDPRLTGNDNPYNGSNYLLWNYVWYTNVTDRDNVEASSSNTYGADGLLVNAKGFYVRKRTDDYDLNSSSKYTYTNANGSNGFKWSASPYMEIRYAEVLLNLAEAACGAEKYSEAVEILKKIRGRVGYTSSNNYGLELGLDGDQAKLFAAILYERQIELAYEGKRFDDMRRWMLFDGGAVTVAGAPSTWTLTGFGGNTCTYLGFTQFNGQRRENMEFRVSDAHNNGLGGTTVSSDPLKDVTRPPALNLNQDLSTQQDALAQFYDTYLTRKKKKGDAYNSSNAEEYIKFFPHYYFLGLAQGAQQSNMSLQQTIGWGDYANGGAPGTFDPLAE